MEGIFGTSIQVFVILTVVIMGGAAYMTGQAVAATWRPVRQIVIYCILLGGVDRFLIASLFGGDGLSVSAFVVDATVLIGIGLVAYRITHVTKMVTQYPWLFERKGLWNYRERPES